jgi:uncharacterized membrane protein
MERETTMRTYLIAYGATALVFLVLDAIWLSSTINSLYRPRIGHLLLEQPRLGVAVPFYLLYVVGVVVFAVLPGLRAQDWTTTLWLGAMLGLFAYGTYDLTNLSTLRGWSVTVTVVDMAWGCVLTATSATAGMLAAQWFTRAA